MAEQTFPIPSYFLVIFFITRLKSTIGKYYKPWTTSLQPKLNLSLDIATKLRTDPESLESASTDFGNIIKEIPSAVLYPSSVNDIINLIKFSYDNSVPFQIAARGRGHSVRGQAMTNNGVVVEMTSMKKFRGSGIVITGSRSSGFYGDVGGEMLWIDVLSAALDYGLAPISWTDYLYVSVGGTLSNGGIGGQSFRYGPQISNVLEMDVITGKGDLVSCSRETNSELFYGVLGGLGQFGIITRARITLEPAPKRVKWVRMLYNDFSAFTRDQERLIPINRRRPKNTVDYLEGILLMHHGPPDNWRSSFFPASDHPRIISLVNQHGIIYCLEVAKYYDEHTESTVDKELQISMEGLEYIEGFKFEKDVSFMEFLNRVRSGEVKLESEGLWDVPHPWLNLFVPKSKISDFNLGVFENIILKRNITTGPVLIYPMNRNKWDDRMSAVIPDEDVFYTIGFLNSSGFGNWQVLEDQNREILEFCGNSDIGIKHYLPQFKTQVDWINHFGSKWRCFLDKKNQFDPKFLLSPGQKIFN